MRLLTILVATVAALYSGYWYIGATTVENGTKTALENLSRDNWEIAVGSVSTRGFPSRFDTTLKDVSIENPDGSLGYEAPFLQAFALSYAPNEVIVAFPDTQKIKTPSQAFDVASSALRASAAVKANTNATLSEVTIESGPLTVVSDVGWETAVSKGLAAVRLFDASANVYDVYGDLNDIALPSQAIDKITQVTNLPSAFQSVTIDARATLTRPLDRFVIEEQGTDFPKPKSIDLRAFDAKWGSATLSAAGNLAFDDVGVTDGQVTVTVVAWDQIIDALVATDRINVDVGQTMANVMNSMANGKSTLTIPVRFKNGLSFIGPIPVGPTPKF